MPYITRSNEDKARQDADFEATAEANKQEWLARARRQAAEDDVRNEMTYDAQEEVIGLDSKTAAEVMLRKKTAIEAQLREWRATNEWPRTKAERAVRDAEVKKANDEAQAKMDAEAKANAAKPGVVGQPIGRDWKAEDRDAEAARAKVDDGVNAAAMQQRLAPSLPPAKPYWPGPEAKAAALDADRKAEAADAAKLAADQQRT